MKLNICRWCRLLKLLVILLSITISTTSAIAQQTSQEKRIEGQTGSPVSFDSRAILIHGESQLIISGEMHYARSPYYHVPKAWLKVNNQLVIFEEQPNLPTKVNLQIRTVN